MLIFGSQTPFPAPVTSTGKVLSGSFQSVMSLPTLCSATISSTVTNDITYMYGVQVRTNSIAAYNFKFFMLSDSLKERLCI